MASSPDTSFAAATAEDCLQPIQALLGELFVSQDAGLTGFETPISTFAGAGKPEALALLRDVRRYALVRLVEARFFGGAALVSPPLYSLEEEFSQRFNIILRIVLDELEASSLQVRLRETLDFAGADLAVSGTAGEVNNNLSQGAHDNVDFAADFSPGDGSVREPRDTGGKIIRLHEDQSSCSEEDC